MINLVILANCESFFEDNSAFLFPSGNTSRFVWSAVFDYAGAASSGSRYRIDGGAWSDYSLDILSLDITDVATGEHTFEVQFRDLGGVESEIALFSYEIVAPTLNSGILVVDDGNGRF